MNWQAVYPVLPEIALLVMACVVAMTDLWIPGKDRIVTYCIAQTSLGVIALGQLWFFYEGATYYAMQRMVVADPMGHLLGLFATLAMMTTLVYTRPYAVSRDMLKGELFTLSMFSLLGILVMLGGQQLPGRLPRPRADVALALRARRHAPRRHRRDRGGDEVLRPRRAGERLPALRPVDDVRRHRLARDQRGLQGDRHRPDQPGGARPRHRLRRRRPRLQARRRAVPHVGARRLPGRADVDDAARRRRAQARRLRDHDPPARRGDDRRRARLAADAGPALARVDAARQPGGDRADQPEADARLFDDRPDRLHAARPVPGRRQRQHGLGRATPTARRCST